MGIGCDQEQCVGFVQRHFHLGWAACWGCLTGVGGVGKKQCCMACIHKECHCTHRITKIFFRLYTPNDKNVFSSVQTE